MTTSYRAIRFAIIILISSSLLSAKESPLIRHNLNLKFELDRHWLKAVDVMVSEPVGLSFSFLLNADFKINKIKVEGKTAKYEESGSYDWELFGGDFEKSDSAFFGRAKMVTVRLKEKYIKRDPLVIEVRYEGEIYDKPSSAAFSRVSVADQTVGLIGAEGIYLSTEGLYYPWAGEGMCTFSVTSETPAEYYIVTDGGLVENEVKKNRRRMRWECDSPADGLYISGAKWDLLRDEKNGTEIYGFFFPEDSALSAQYVDAVKRYLELYEGLFGEYAYPKFAVAENFFPTGYGMPSWTLLGQAVVRLPWIVNISLGHEVCHNWWGNGVFVDYKSGNWCEGLTTYSADYLFKERNSDYEARSYRRTVNQDYTAYVSESNDFPLRNFRSREETYTRAIGYGKSMMVFHMLRKMVGEDDYWGALQDFYRENLFEIASWDDIQAAFEGRTGNNLNWFFGQWVDNRGAPIIEMTAPELEFIANQYTIHFQLKVLNGDFRLYIPIVIYFEEGEEMIWNYFAAGIHDVRLAADKKPSAVAVDPDFEVFRLLDRDEYPPSLSEVLGAEKQVIVLPSKASAEKLKAYQETAEALNRSGEALIMPDTEVKLAEASDNSYFIFGTPEENSLLSYFAEKGLNFSGKLSFYNDGHFNLKGENFNQEQVSCMITMRNPLNRNQSIAVFSASAAEEINRTGTKLIHYGKYSYLAFVEGRNTMKGNWETVRSPLYHKFE